jgi:glycosyltransferase involved in cell wall biosynthesis
MTAAPAMRLAVAHDALVYAGGAERVMAYLVERWPGVPLYTSAYLPDATYPAFRSADVRSSFLQRFASDPQTVMRRIFPLMIPAFRSFDFTDYEIVLSSAAYAAKALRVPPHVCHVCYCYSPLRLAWRPQDYLPAEAGPIKRAVADAAAAPLRWWDSGVAKKVHAFATTSQNVAKRIREAYGCEAEVIPAPIDTARYRLKTEADDYYLIVSRLNPYKRVDLAIAAAARLGRPLVVVGEGPNRAELQQMAAPNTSFLGHVSDDELLELYSRCRALIFPQEEDYGLTPLEAQASGRPVVAYAAGGALETVVADETGVFFTEQSVDSLVDALERCDRLSFDRQHITRHAAKFDVDVFCDRMRTFLERHLAECPIRQPRDGRS